jgi:hypothetical protein
MHLKLIPALVATAVPVLAAHNFVGYVPVSALARAVTPDGTDAFIQHVRLGPNARLVAIAASVTSAARSRARTRTASAPWECTS